MNEEFEYSLVRERISTQESAEYLTPDNVSVKLEGVASHFFRDPSFFEWAVDELSDAVATSFKTSYSAGVDVTKRGSPVIDYCIVIDGSLITTSGQELGAGDELSIEAFLFHSKINGFTVTCTTDVTIGVVRIADAYMDKFKESLVRHRYRILLDVMHLVSFSWSPSGTLVRDSDDACVILVRGVVREHDGNRIFPGDFCVLGEAESTIGVVTIPVAAAMSASEEFRGAYDEMRFRRTVVEEHPRKPVRFIITSVDSGTSASSERSTEMSKWLVGPNIGNGASSRVYRSDRGHAALKFVERGDERLQREIRALQTLGHHDNIITLLDVVDDVKYRHVVIVLALCDWGSLAGVRLSARECVSAFVSMASALDHVHRLGYVHCDVKPGNVFRDGTGKVILGDFGSAVQLGYTPCGTGTIAFCSPESLRKERADRPLDIWALAATVHCLFYGRTPFPCDDRLAESIRKATPRFGVDWSVDDACLRSFIQVGMMKKDSERATLAELISHEWCKLFN